MPDSRSGIVVNTGPLIALGACSHIELLRHFHDRVLVPTAVAEELKRGLGTNESWRRMDWLDVKEPSGLRPIAAASLDDGEAAVIELALEFGISLVAIDERRGRLAARLSRLEVTGSLGLLLRGKRAGLVTSVTASIELMKQYGIWIKPSVVQTVLRESGESND